MLILHEEYRMSYETRYRFSNKQNPRQFYTYVYVFYSSGVNKWKEEKTCRENPKSIK